jgi:hypothetical protein
VTRAWLRRATPRNGPTTRRLGDEEEGSPGRFAPGSRAVSGLDERSRTFLEEISPPGNVPDGKCRADTDSRTAI